MFPYTKPPPDLRLVWTMTLRVAVLVTAAVAVTVAASTSPVSEMSSSAQWATWARGSVDITIINS